MTFNELMAPGETREQAYKRLARACHPDLHPDNPKATEEFQRLNDLYNHKPQKVVIGKWVILDALSRGDIANLYNMESGHVFKIARTRADNDLMDRERRALTMLAGKVVAEFNHYFPAILDSVSASGRRANILPLAEGFFALDSIASMYHGRLPFQHVVWMGNRLFSALGFAHSLGLVHGAILPSHLMYYPSNHDMRLVDWCYSSTPSEHVPSVVSACKAFYPPEVLAKQPATPAVDIFMAAATLRSVSSAPIPKLFRDLFDWCQAGSPLSRPSEIWALQDRWRDAALQTYGKPTFVPLVLPVH